MYQPLISSSVKDAEHAQRMYWEEIDLLRTTLEMRKDQPRFIFYEGRRRQTECRGFTTLFQEISRTPSVAIGT